MGLLQLPSCQKCGVSHRPRICHLQRNASVTWAVSIGKIDHKLPFSGIGYLQ